MSQPTFVARRGITQQRALSVILKIAIQNTAFNALRESRTIHNRGGAALFLLFKLVTLGIFQTSARQVLKHKGSYI